MDDSTFYLAAGVLILALIVVFTDAISTSFETPDGLWTMLTGFAAFLGARAVIKNGRNK